MTPQSTYIAGIGTGVAIAAVALYVSTPLIATRATQFLSARLASALGLPVELTRGFQPIIVAEVAPAVRDAINPLKSVNV